MGLPADRPGVRHGRVLTLTLVPDQAMRPTDDEEGEENQSWTVPAPEFPTGAPIRLVRNVHPECTRELPAGLS